MTKRAKEISSLAAPSDPRFEPPAVSRISTSDILTSPLPPLDWVVPDCLSNELTLLAGNQNSGKTWLALDISVAVSTGGKALGSIACEPGDVLYVDLENGPRNLRKRLTGWYPDRSAMPDLARLSWTNDAPGLSDERFVGALDDWWTAEAAPRLVVIDGALKLRPSRAPGGYDGDIAAMRRLRTWSNARGVAVLFLCRTRGSGDPLEMPDEASGALAMADATLWLDRRGPTATLHMSGRSLPEAKWALKFAEARWTLAGDAAEFLRSEQRRRILEVFGAQPDEDAVLEPVEVGDEADMPVANVRKLLARMVKSGDLERVGYGRYRLAYD